jgi:hypothetical protein
MPNRLMRVITALVVGLYSLAGLAFGEERGEPALDWRETQAYTLGVQAYVYGFPYLYMSQLRWRWTTQPIRPDKTPYMALNTFWHRRGLLDATFREGGSANNDTLYSLAWLDVSKEPVILCHPDLGTRYFTFQISDYSSDNFAYVGKRATGSKAGCFAVARPDWKGELPKGVRMLERAPTPFVFVVGRTLVDGADDVKNVTALQDQYTLTPLSYFGKGIKAPERRDVWAPFDAKSDPLADWKTINRAMEENAPPAQDARILAMFAQVGIGPGQNLDAQDEATKRGLVRALKDGRALLQATILGGNGAKVVNGWRYFVKPFGRAGVGGQFLLRGALQSLAGIVANDPEENLYPMALVDQNGEPLTGQRSYTIRFAKDALPPVDAFWSVTMYGMDYNLVANSANRYSVGDRTHSLKYAADGSLTIYVQNTAPEGDAAANWLPAPEGSFYLLLRLYLPKRAVIDGTWMPPAVTAAH